MATPCSHRDWLSPTDYLDRVRQHHRRRATSPSASSSTTSASSTPTKPMLSTSSQPLPRSILSKSTGWRGHNYIGSQIDCDRTSRTVALSTPGYIDKVLHRFCPDGVRGAASPMIYTQPRYGSSAPQLVAAPDTSPLHPSRTQPPTIDHRLSPLLWPRPRLHVPHQRLRTLVCTSPRNTHRPCRRGPSALLRLDAPRLLLGLHSV